MWGLTLASGSVPQCSHPAPAFLWAAIHGAASSRRAPRTPRSPPQHGLLDVQPGPRTAEGQPRPHGHERDQCWSPQGPGCWASGHGGAGAEGWGCRGKWLQGKLPVTRKADEVTQVESPQLAPCAGPGLTHLCRFSGKRRRVGSVME